MASREAIGTISAVLNVETTDVPLRPKTLFHSPLNSLPGNRTKDPLPILRPRLTPRTAHRQARQLGNCCRSFCWAFCHDNNKCGGRGGTLPPPSPPPSVQLAPGPAGMAKLVLASLTSFTWSRPLPGCRRHCDLLSMC